MAWLSSVRAARPSFAEGLARIFDLGNTLADPYYAPAFEDDMEAFAHDWRVLGADLASIALSPEPATFGRASSGSFGSTRPSTRSTTSS